MIKIISKFENYTKEQLQDILNDSKTFKEALEKIGLSGIGNNYKTLHKYIDKYKLSTKNIDENKNKNANGKNYTTKETFTNAIINGTCKIKQRFLIERLIKFNLKEYKCEECGISEWNGKSIKLELHHENGKHDDNRLCNLKLLCPNCHSQTDNFRALNIAK